MRWPSRRNSPLPSSDAAIERFWRWWVQVGRAAIDAALAANEPHRIASDLSARVAAINDSLSWELASGADSHNLLVVSAEGDPELRPVARRWLLAAPAADQEWAYADLKQPADDVSSIELSLGDVTLPLGEVMVAARVSGARLDVMVHHPHLAELPDQSRVQATFLALDYAIGERAVELWLGAVNASQSMPLDAFSLSHLRTLVTEHEARLVDESGNPSWVVLNGTGPKGTVIAATQSPLASITAPELDVHVGLVIPYPNPTEAGLPSVEDLRELTTMEDHLCERLGSDGRLVAHESSAGERILHFYVAGGTHSPELLEAASSGWPHGPVEVTTSPDPSWSAVQHLRT